MDRVVKTPLRTTKDTSFMSLGAFSGARTETKKRKTDESTGAQVKIKLLDQWLYRVYPGIVAAMARSNNGFVPILPGLNFFEYGLYGTSIRRRSRCRAVPPVRGVGAVVDDVVVDGVVNGSGGGWFERNTEGVVIVVLVVVEASKRNALLTSEAAVVGPPSPPGIFPFINSVYISGSNPPQFSAGMGTKYLSRKAMAL